MLVSFRYAGSLPDPIRHLLVQVVGGGAAAVVAAVDETLHARGQLVVRHVEHKPLPHLRHRTGAARGKARQRRAVRCDLAPG